MQNFIKIGQTGLEIGVGRKKNFHTHTCDTHTQTHGILTGPTASTFPLGSQHVRGATNNKQKPKI